MEMVHLFDLFHVQFSYALHIPLVLSVLCIMVLTGDLFPDTLKDQEGYTLLTSI